jgi:hypothetical protein
MTATLFRELEPWTNPASRDIAVNEVNQTKGIEAAWTCESVVGLIAIATGSSSLMVK